MMYSKAASKLTRQAMEEDGDEEAPDSASVHSGALICVSLFVCLFYFFAVVFFFLSSINSDLPLLRRDPAYFKGIRANKETKCCVHAF